MGKRKMPLIFVYTVLSLAVVCVFILIMNYFLFTVGKFEGDFTNLPADFDGYKIVQLSDLHRSKYGKDNAKIVDAVKKINPDIVVMTGDMIEPDESGESFWELSRTLAASYEVYYIKGNHELRGTPKFELNLMKTLGEIGVKTLENEKAEIKKGSSVINIYGLTYGLEFYGGSSKKKSNATYFSLEEMNKLLGSKDNEGFNILLTHNPIYFETYAEWGADLTFCGHIHGGLIRLPFIGGILSPDVTLFPKYDGGIYELNSRKMLVSRGLSAGNFGLRFLNSPEIISITLKKK